MNNVNLIKFDKNQNKAGYNKYGWYQFGSETCRYCKNDDTERIRDIEELKPYIEFYKNKPFKAFHCFACGARWSKEIKLPKTQK